MKKSMTQDEKPRILILSASFGDGHNSAARGIIQALGTQVECRLTDPCANGQPLTNTLFKKSYQAMVIHFPKLWEIAFKFTDIYDMSKDPMPALYGIRQETIKQIENYQPDLIISTYPLYPYFIDSYKKKSGKNIPYFLVVTDSLIINKSWLCCHPNAWLVTDDITKNRMIHRGLPAEKIIVTGFPVNPYITQISHLTQQDWSPYAPAKILYFATGSKRQTTQDITAILNALPFLSVTIVLGRHTRRLYSTCLSLKQNFPQRIKIKGWTRHIPQLLAEHHLAIGKSGGATTHEAMAAQCPLIVNQVVYGQEQGNTELLEHFNVGEKAIGAKEITATLKQIFSGDNPTWFTLKNNLQSLNLSSGALHIRDIIGQTLKK